MKTPGAVDSSNWLAGTHCTSLWQDAADSYGECMFPSPPPPPAPEAAPSGTWPLFTFRGIRVFLHWSWILVAVYHINKGQGEYPHIGWDIGEYLVLFGIVLVHEFGHAFATRQVGGIAERILLWPFGGIAFVQTPPRAGAYLWGIAAGPLVNVVLWPILYFIVSFYGDPFRFYSTGPLGADGYLETMPLFLHNIFWINTVMLIFNLIPAYPLDGGQIFRGILWFFVGPMKSLLIAAWTGLVLGGAAMIFVIVKWQALWLAVMMGLIVQQSWMAISRVREWNRQMRAR